MTTQTTKKAVVGRRILFTRYSDLGKPDAAKPGIITELALNQGGQVAIRLDGKRYTLHIPANYQGLTYLDEITEVPALPMGAFTPTAADFGGTVHRGVPVCLIDSDDMIALTDDRDTAMAAVADYCAGLGLDVDSVSLDRLKGVWAVFEWEPEDAEMPWTVRWSDDLEGDDQAVRIYYLPA